MWDKARVLADKAQTSTDPGYILALLLLILRVDAMGRINAHASARYLRSFARDLHSYGNLLVALSENILSRRLTDLTQNLTDLGKINFQPSQLVKVDERIGTVAEYLLTMETDKQDRIKIGPVQERINELQQAIGRSH